MYTDKVIDRFKNPQNAGDLKGANATGTVGNPACGDIMQLYLKINPETEIIEDAHFKTFGCAAAIASTDVACDLIKGKTIDEALTITNRQVVETLGELPPQKIHCSVLAEEAIADAIKNYRNKN